MSQFLDSFADELQKLAQEPEVLNVPLPKPAAPPKPRRRSRRVGGSAAGAFTPKPPTPAPPQTEWASKHPKYRYMPGGKGYETKTPRGGWAQYEGKIPWNIEDQMKHGPHDPPPKDWPGKAKVVHRKGTVPVGEYGKGPLPFYVRTRSGFPVRPEKEQRAAYEQARLKMLRERYPIEAEKEYSKMNVPMPSSLKERLPKVKAELKEQRRRQKEKEWDMRARGLFELSK